VGLYHGTQSGHLLVYCNSKIVLIDFKVRESKTYSMFLDEELLELKLDRKENTFFYSFQINKEADTPRNRQRIEDERRDLRQAVIVLAGFLLLVALSVLVVQWLNSSPLQ
jgi:hypothetical protein